MHGWLGASPDGLVQTLGTPPLLLFVLCSCFCYCFSVQCKLADVAVSSAMFLLDNTHASVSCSYGPLDCFSADAVGLGLTIASDQLFDCPWAHNENAGLVYISSKCQAVSEV